MGSKRRARGDDFGIVFLHGGGNDDDARLAEIFGLMADGDCDALLAQALDIGVVGQIAALNLVAEIMQDFGDAAHADAADADEMNDADRFRAEMRACG